MAKSQRKCEKNHHFLNIFIKFKYLKIDLFIMANISHFGHNIQEQDINQVLHVIVLQKQTWICPKICKNAYKKDLLNFWPFFRNLMYLHHYIFKNSQNNPSKNTFITTKIKSTYPCYQVCQLSMVITFKDFSQT